MIYYVRTCSCSLPSILSSFALSLSASIHTLYFYPISTLPSFVGWFSFTHSLILLLAGLGQTWLTLTSILHSQSATTIPTLTTLLNSIRLVSCCCCSVQGVQADENLSFSDRTKILTFSHYFSSTLLVLLCTCVFRNSFQLVFCIYKVVRFDLVHSKLSCSFSSRLIFYFFYY